MDVRALKLIAGCALSAALLSACGGGGGSDSGAPTSVSAPAVVPVAGTTFSLADSYKARIVSGSDDSFVLSGSCTGTAKIETSRAVAAVFEGVPGFSSAQTVTVSASAPCSPSTNPAITQGTTFYNDKYLNIGLSVPPTSATQANGEWAKFEALPPTNAIPAFVQYGDPGGPIVTLLTYTDSTKATATGRREFSYSVEADNTLPTNAVAVITTKTFGTNGALQSTQQTRYRMSSGNNTLALLSIDVLFSAPSNLHLVYTPR